MPPLAGGKSGERTSTRTSGAISALRGTTFPAELGHFAPIQSHNPAHSGFLTTRSLPRFTALLSEGSDMCILRAPKRFGPVFRRRVDLHHGRRRPVYAPYK